MSIRLYKILIRLRPAFITVVLKRLLGIKRRTITTDHGLFFVDPVSSFGLSLLCEDDYDWKYEWKMVNVLRAYLQDGSVFIDVGANEGYFSVMASKLVGSHGHVYAIEPQSRLQAILEQNFKLNSVANTSIIKAALSDKTGEASIYLSPDINTGSTALFNSTKYALPKESIKTTTLAELFSQKIIERCDLMKMDIESYEYEAILGSPQIFESGQVKALILELHPDLLAKRGYNSDDIVAFLRGCGYSIDHRFEHLVFTWPATAASSN